MKKQQALLERLDAIEKQIKAIIKSFDRVPDSIDDVKGRRWWIYEGVEIYKHTSQHANPNDFSTKQRAKAMLALGQLIEIHAAIEQEESTYNCSITIGYGKDIKVLLYFESQDLLIEFKTKHKDLIETVERGL